MEGKLKPCPFCGKEPGVKHCSDLISIGCQSSIDNCPVRIYTPDLPPKLAISFWNTRAPIEITEEMVEMAAKVIADMAVMNMTLSGAGKPVLYNDEGIAKAALEAALNSKNNK